MIRKWRYKRNSYSPVTPVEAFNKMADNAGYEHNEEKTEDASDIALSRITFDNGDKNVEDNRRTSDEKTIDKEDTEQGMFSKVLSGMGDSTAGFFKSHKKIIRYLALAILNLAVFGYFFVALNYWHESDRGREWEFCDGFGMLLILYSIIYFFIIYFLLVKQFFGKAIRLMLLRPIYKCYVRLWKLWYIKLGLTLAIFAALIVFLILDTEGSRERLVSMVGFLALLLFGFVFSRSPGRITWRPVLWGILLQFALGLLTIRWQTGREILICIGNKVTAFLNFGNAGSGFVYSDYLVNEIKVFAFGVLPIIYFFSLMIDVMFYFGAMQWICLKLGWWLQISMATTVCESVICAANTFLGMSESPLLIKPYFVDLTKSEIHTIMASGFATVSGSTLAAYISFGVQPSHLITSSVMSAPAALCYSKLFFPETVKSQTAVHTIKTVTSEHSSVLEAAATGAANAVPLVLGITANLVAFVSLVAFLNGVLGWLGALVGLDFLSFEWVFGKVFIPLSWVMGVPWAECELVGSLIGLKTVINEFVAYQRMGEYKKQGLLSSRGEAIATYALCGFTNPSAVGIMVGALTAMAPSRKADIVSVVGRAFVTGCAVCFMTACIAGLLIPPGSFVSPPVNSTLFL